MFIVTGAVQARADTVDELLRLSAAYVAGSRAEPGCVEHGVAVDAGDGLRLVFFQRWADRAALNAHFEEAASREFVYRIAKLAAHPPQMAIYEAREVVAAGDADEESRASEASLRERTRG